VEPLGRPFGSALAREELPVAEEIPKAGEQDVRIIVQEPGKMRVLRTRRVGRRGV
jgi:hypothetical protein